MDESTWEENFEDHEWHNMYHEECNRLKIEYSPNLMYSLGNVMQKYIGQLISTKEKEAYARGRRDGLQFVVDRSLKEEEIFGTSQGKLYVIPVKAFEAAQEEGNNGEV